MGNASSKRMDFDAWTDAELNRLAAAMIRRPFWPRFKLGRLLDYVAWRQPAPRDGLWLEFGVYRGRTINRLARRAPGLVYGFDSFEGLPEDWDRGAQFTPKGAFHVNGVAPHVRRNVRLAPGWFAATLPDFLAETPGKVALMHIDCDIYSSTKTVFDCLADRIGPGTTVVFDELINYPTFRDHEWRALYEFVAATGLDIEWIGTFGGVRRDFADYVGMRRERLDHGRDPEAALIFR